MEANTLQREIRIGNYLLGKVEDEIDERKVYWETYQIKDAEDLMGVKLDWDKPIPLSEDILLKLGFEKIGVGTVHDMQFIGYRIGVWDVYAIENGEFVVHKNTKETSIANVKFVHQLQNLYFALTNLELTIKE